MGRAQLASPPENGSVMKFIGLDIDGTPWVGRLDEGGVLPLSTVADFWAEARGWLERASTAPGESLPRDAVREIPFVPASARVFCIGLNYRAHAAEGGF